MPTISGVHYFLHEGGSRLKPTVILVHGAAGDNLSWPAEMRRLPGHRVFAIDLPGHGKTTGPGCQSVEEYTQSILYFMDANDLARAVVVGYSMGGAIALTLALDHPERLAGIGLVSTGTRLPIPGSILENAANPTTFTQASRNLLELSLGSQAPASLKETLFKRLVETRQTLMLGDLLACDHFDVTGRLEDIRVPTLVVCGTDDKMTPIRGSETLASQIPGAALQTVEGAGHLLLLEQPRRLAKLISIFLATIPFQPGR